MLTKRIIPCMDVKDGRVVKGVNFVDLRDAGDPVELAAFYDREGADEVVFLDITATSDNRATMVDMAPRAACEVRIPYTVGGGFRDVPGFAKRSRLVPTNAPSTPPPSRTRPSSPVPPRHLGARRWSWPSTPSTRAPATSGRSTLPEAGTRPATMT